MLPPEHVAAANPALRGGHVNGMYRDGLTARCAARSLNQALLHEQSVSDEDCRVTDLRFRFDAKDDDPGDDTRSPHA